MVFHNVPRLHGLFGCGVLVAAATAPIGCGDDQFSGCEASRTCPPTQGGDTGGGGEAGGEGGSGQGGSIGGDGGGGGAPECTRHADCDDSDATNGVERCVDASCEPGNPPPTVEAVTPDDGEDGVVTDATISIEFSEPLDPDTVTLDTIRVSVGGTGLSGNLEYDDQTTVTFTPTERLYLLGTHVVTVGVEVTDADGAALIEPFESTFEVQDGAWGALGALPDAANAEMPRVAAAGAGDLLVGWSSPTGLLTRWYRSADGWDDVETLSDCVDCTSLGLAGNRAGVAIAAYASGSRVFARQYRDGEWEPQAQEVLDVSEADPSFSVAVSPIGEAHVLVARKEGANAGVLVSRRTSAAGVWAESDQTDPGVVSYAPELAFDASGDGLALWALADSNAASVYFARYDQSEGVWSSHTPIPSSSSASAGNPGVAFGAAGSAMAAWTSFGTTAAETRLVASEYSDGDFGAPAPLNAANEGIPGSSPQVAFDGSDFVVAWTETRSAGVSRVYTNRHADGDWQGAEARDVQGSGTSYYWMPYLGVDATGNLQLLWRSTTLEVNWDEVLSSRYSRSAASWSAPTPVFSTLVNLNDRDLSLEVSTGGVSAVLVRYQLQDFSAGRSAIALFE